MEEAQFDDILYSLKNGSKKRDPRSVRLAAVTSAILDVVGEDPTAPKVYARVVNALEGTLSTENASISESLATQVALLELLVTTVPHVKPTAIISATLPATSRVLRGSIAHAVGSEAVSETKDELGGANACLRWTCKAVTEVLRCVDSCADEKIVKQLYFDVLVATFQDKRPKVRKAAQGGAVELIRMEDPRSHPIIVSSTSAYAHSELKKYLKNINQVQSSVTDLLHLLNFLQQMIPYLKYEKLSADVMGLVTALLQTETSSDFVVRVKETTPKILALEGALSVVMALFDESASVKKDFLDEFATRLLASLLQANPAVAFRTGRAENEALNRARIVYGECIIACINHVVLTKPELAIKLIPLSIQMVLLLSRPSPDSNDVNVGQSLLVSTTQLFRQRLPGFLSSGHADLSSCLHSSLVAMQQVMQASYQEVWSVGLKCLVALIQQLSESPMIPEVVEKLIQLRNQCPSGSPAQNAVEDAVSVLVQAVGIETCWPWIQWNPDGGGRGVQKERGWLLATIKSAANVAHGKRQKLSFFQNYVLPVARDCDQIASAKPKESNFYRAQVCELWSLFPVFCKTADDAASSLEALGATLAKALEDERYPDLLVTVTGGLSKISNCIEETGNDVDRGALSATAVKLLPVLFKLVSTRPVLSHVTNEKNGSTSSDSMKDSHSVSLAIASLSKSAPRDFLLGLFKKLMHRLLQEVQTDQGNEKSCALLGLSQALVASRVLDDDSALFLYRVLKTVLQSDAQDARVQKRAYKVLAELCECHHSFFSEFQQMKELLTLLTESSEAAQSSARHMRLKCLNILVDGFDDSHAQHVEEIMKLLPEILISLKDSNRKNREAGYQLLLSVAVRKERQQFLQTLTAALGAETSHMRSAAVMALSRIVFELAWEDESIQQILPMLLKTVLVLVDENSREVVKSTIGFIRISVAAIPKEQLEPLLPDLVGGLLHYHKAKSRFRSKIKIIVKKLVRLFGYETLQEFVPETESRLITHMRKLDERQKRKKMAARDEISRSGGKDGFDELLGSDEDDSDDGRTFTTGATGFTKMTAMTGRSKKSALTKDRTKSMSGTIATSKTLRSAEPSRLPGEENGEPLDMLEAKFNQRVHFDADAGGSDSDSNGEMEFDDDGRLVIPNDDQDSSPPEETTLESNKRLRTSKLEHVKAVQQEARRSKGRRNKELGASYKSKRAGGDVKKKNQRFEPYAFVPLDGKSYSKKNRRDAVDQMASVVRKGGKRKR